jgi:hypothetical protein
MVLFYCPQWKTVYFCLDYLYDSIPLFFDIELTRKKLEYPSIHDSTTISFKNPMNLTICNNWVKMTTLSISNLSYFALHPPNYGVHIKVGSKLHLRNFFYLGDKIRKI